MYIIPSSVCMSTDIPTESIYVFSFAILFRCFISACLGLVTVMVTTRLACLHWRSSSILQVDSVGLAQTPPFNISESMIKLA